MDPRRDAGLAAIEPLFQDLFRWNGGRQQQSLDVLHEGLWTAKEERAIAEIAQMLEDQFTTEPPLLPSPSVIWPCQNHNPLQLGEPFLQRLQLGSKDNVLARSHAVEESHLGIQGEIVNVSEHRHHRRDPAASSKKDNPLVNRLVKVESPKWSTRLHREAHRRALIQEMRNASRRILLNSDFD